MSTVKKICICSFCAAMCYVLPLIFHALALGWTFSPMHLPVLLCGLLCGGPYGLFCGLAGPVLSCVLSGMPGPVQLVSMVPELCVYGLVTGLGARWVYTGKTVADLYCSLVPAMILGRITGGVVQAVFFLSTARSYTLAMWAGSYVVGTLPGAVLQLVLLPALVWGLGRARLIPARYPRQAALC